jgi:hypothetical protein
LLDGRSRADKYRRDASCLLDRKLVPNLDWICSKMDVSMWHDSSAIGRWSSLLGRVDTVRHNMSVCEGPLEVASPPLYK